MTKLLSLMFVTAVAFNAQAAQQNDAKYLTLTKVKMTDVTEQYAQETAEFTQAGLYEDCNQSNSSFNNSNIKPMTTFIPGVGLDVVAQADVILDQIVNLGKKVWGLIEQGRPVVNVTTATANALPTGLKCWSDLTGWQVPRSKVYRVQYENAYGMNVVDFAYRVTFTAGGALNGHGKYITNATIMPADMNVSWGFKFNANVEVPSIFNMGTKEDPVAGMQLLLKWNIDTVMNHVEQAETFYFGGDNTMKHLD
jgi:hypothetical protein